MSTIEPTETSLGLQTASLSLENRQSKFSKFERLVQPVFSYLFEFFDVESIIHFQRGSNRQIFGQCSFALHHYLGKFKVFKYSDMHLIRAIRPHPRFWGDTQGNFLVSREQINDFDHLLRATPNVAFLDFSNLPEQNYIMRITPHLKELKKLSGISFANSSVEVNYVSEILQSEGLEGVTSLDVSSTDTSLTKATDISFLEFIAANFPKLEYLNLNNTSYDEWHDMGMMVIAHRCKNLKSLKIRDYTINSDFARYLSQCIHLTELDIKISKTTSRMSVQTIFESCENITSLTLLCCYHEREVLEIIGNECKKLKVLKLVFFSQVEHLKMLTGCTNLQEINITTSEDFDVSIIEFFQLNLPVLRKLYINKKNYC